MNWKLFIFSGSEKFYFAHKPRQLKRDTESDFSCLQTKTPNDVPTCRHTKPVVKAKNKGKL